MRTKERKVRKAAEELSKFTVGPHNIDELIAGITRQDKTPSLIVIDLFCGAGGTSTGFEMTNGDAIVIACVNHDYKAIKSHWRNYPHIAHFEEDIRTLELSSLVKLLAHYRKLYPTAKVVLWASLECTNFSKAKGGQPRDADSRTLADHLDRYIQALNPDYIQIENVVEFMSWGPLDENGKPLSRRNGIDFMRWCNYINSFGYYNEWREMNSADFGAYTSRNRLFGCFAKNGLPIVWPDTTHARQTVSKAASQRSLFDQKELKPWKAVKDVLDFKDEGNSIFDRKTPLSDKTLERIYAGLIKYVAGGKDAFLLKYNSVSNNGSHVPPSVDEPCPVIATQNRLGSVFITKYYSGHPGNMILSVDEPAATLRCKDGQALVNPVFITQRNSGEPDGRVVDINGPARTLTSTAGNQDVITVGFLNSYYGNGGVTSLNDSCPTLTTKDRIGLVKPSFIVRDFTSWANHSSIEQPMGTLLTTPKANVVTCEPFIMNTNYTNGPSSINEPVHTITASRKHQYIVNPSHGGHSTSVDAPCPVIIARQDKAPLYLVASEEGDIAVRIDDSDSECMRKIKEFMVLYSIVDIKMRMLKVSELLTIQGFPTNYQLEGSQQDQKKFIGNSVVPVVVRSWAQAMINKIKQAS